MSEQNEQDGLEEIVLLFDAEGASVSAEMRFTEFEALVNQVAPLDEHAASVVKAVYGVVATGLTVPWHATNLWQPEGEGDAHPSMLAQKAVWRNRLGLKPMASRPIQDDVMGSTITDEQLVLEERLTHTFGEEGKVSLQQLIA
ncbi:MAG: hypothetical protein VB948_02605, partial [Pseudomonadales bacterium]